MDQRLVIPGAIVVGAVIISVGLFLGLRSRPVMSAPAPAQQPAPVATAPVAPPPPPWTPVSGEEQRQLDQQVRASLEHQRAKLAQACWQPMAKKAKVIAKDYELRLIFDPKGKMITCAVNDPPDEAGKEVARCLRSSPPEVAVAPVGKYVTVQLGLRLP